MFAKEVAARFDAAKGIAGGIELPSLSLGMSFPESGD